MPDYTPGPWMIDLDNHMLSSCIAEVVAIANDDCDGDFSSPKEYADARLIAAAPEMLEALERIEELMDSLAPLRRTDLFNADQQAKAAIAKAKGG